MNVLFISKEGDSLPIAQRVMKEGHRAIFYMEEKNARKIGDGMVEKATFQHHLLTRGGGIIRDHVESLLQQYKPELAVFDMVGMGRVADFIRGKGVPVFGSSAWADHAELDRDYGHKLMKSAGINVPATTQWKKSEYGKAVEYVKRSKRRYVYKPHGNLDTSHTYVGRGVDDMVAMLTRWEGEADFQLEEWVEGVEVSCEVWWNGLHPLFYSWTMEDKAFMSSNIGPFVGSAGSIVHIVDERTRLVQEGIGRTLRLLKQVSYKGPLDLNAIVTTDKLYGLEFTARFGYDAIQSLLELHRGSLVQLLHHTASGTDPHSSFYKEYGISIRLSIPPYPHHQPGEVGVPILGVTNESLKHIWFSDIKSGKDEYETAGYDGIVGAVTARGSDVREAQRRAHRTIENLTIPQVQYRDDIGDRVRTRRHYDEWGKKVRQVEGDEATLRKWGWL